MNMKNNDEWVAHAKEMLDFLKKYDLVEKEKTKSQLPEANRKRALLNSLLSGETPASEFKERAKEAGFFGQMLSIKQEWQKGMEFWGKYSRIRILGGEPTFQEVFDRFEEYAPQITDIFKHRTRLDASFDFDDEDSVIFKISNKGIPEEERLKIWTAHSERWGEE